MTHKMYTFMRNDMASMTGGRAAAQAKHLSYVQMKEEKNVTKRHENALQQWKERTYDGCGTEIVLGCSDAVIEEVMNLCADIAKVWPNHAYVHGQFVDPEYWIKDGDVAHAVHNVRTCAFVFWPEDESLRIDRMIVNFPTSHDAIFKKLVRLREIIESLELF